MTISREKPRRFSLIKTNREMNIAGSWQKSSKPTRDMTNEPLLFLLNTYNDIDHIAPVVWKCSVKGNHCIIIFSRHYDWTGDYRVHFLLQSPNVEVFEPAGMRTPTIIGGIYRRLRYGGRFARRFLTSRRIRACVTEWYRPSDDMRGRLLGAVHALKIPSFSLPHGCNVHLNYNTKHARAKEKVKQLGRWADVSGMNVCDCFVVDSPYNRRMYMDGGIEPQKCEAWGSARFCPEWVAKNVEICPPFAVPGKDAEKLKVAFFLPHWRNNVNQDATVGLIKRIANLPWIYLVVKSHTRGNGEFPEERRQELGASSSVAIDPPSHSPSLIRWSDVVINFGSSIGIDALVQEKPLIYPVYLHGNTTIFDASGACLKTESENEVMSLLAAARENAMPAIAEDNKKHLYKEVIYGGREPFDVLGYYTARISGQTGNIAAGDLSSRSMPSL